MMKLAKLKRVVIIVTSISMIVVASAIGAVNAEAKAPMDKEKEKAGDFIRGAQVWANNCTRCHNVRDPKEFNDREWQVIISHMRIRAGLTGQEARDTLQFMQQSNN